MANVLASLGYTRTYHVTPIHYVPYIARMRMLLSKRRLRTAGFTDAHFRSTSRRADDQRGFGGVVHTALCAVPPILESKLRLGIPHVEIIIPTDDLAQGSYALCRYNIAKNRGLFRESEVDGRLYSAYALPVAITELEQQAMLRAHGQECLEVLFFEKVDLPLSCHIRVFSTEDAITVQRVLKALDVGWNVDECPSPVAYSCRPSYRNVADQFIARVLEDPTWTGFPIEFDR